MLQHTRMVIAGNPGTVLTDRSDATAKRKESYDSYATLDGEASIQSFKM